MKKIHYLLFLGLLATACSEDESLSVSDKKLQKDPAVRLVEDFYQAVQPKATRGTLPDLVIDNIQRQMYHAVGDTILPINLTRAVGGDSLCFEIQTVTFHTGQQQGYAIVSDDERLNRLYYFTADGQLTDTVSIPPLKELIDNVPLFAKKEIESEQQGVTTRAAGDVFIDNIVRTKWSQAWPFNLYAKACNCSQCNDSIFKGHNPIGCTNVAVAQLIAHYGIFPGTYYGNQNINFASLPAKGPMYEFYPEKVKVVAQFFHEIALCCETKFRCSGSAATPRAACNYLRDMGYNCIYSSGPLNQNQLKQDLQNNFPHYIANAEHAWLITGMKVENAVLTVYCNWGHGGASDGWSYTNPFIENTINNGEITYSGPYYHIYLN